MGTEQFVFKGSNVLRVRRPPKTYEPERTCSKLGCDTRLSIYNGTDRCNQHRLFKQARTRGVKE